jgi:hypothetical protein
LIPFLADCSQNSVFLASFDLLHPVDQIPEPQSVNAFKTVTSRPLKDDSAAALSKHMVEPAPLFTLRVGDFSRPEERQKVLVHPTRKSLAIVALFVLHKFSDKFLPANAEAVVARRRQRTGNLEGICVEKA